MVWLVTPGAKVSVPAATLKSAASALPARVTGSTYSYDQTNYEILVDSPILAGRYYREWALSPRVDLNALDEVLSALREVCTARGIVLIFDEVFVGFRLAPGGAQEYFGVQADLVTYGKTLGGGLPVGVVCGGRALMQRWREGRPADPTCGGRKKT